MHTIMNYIDNLFLTMPKTQEMHQLKNDLLLNMEDKYNELKEEGKTENEAVGIVIAEFGNIDELTKEMGINPNTNESKINYMEMDQVINYINAKKQSAPEIAIGVGLCILSVAVFMFFASLANIPFVHNLINEDTLTILGLIPMFLIIACGVGLLILSENKLEPYKKLKYGFIMKNNVRDYVFLQKSDFSAKKNHTILASIMLYILSPVFLFVFSLFGETASIWGVVSLLIVVAIATTLIIYVSTIDEAYDFLIKKTDKTKRKGKG